jgi:hypothetical protein
MKDIIFLIIFIGGIVAPLVISLSARNKDVKFSTIESPFVNIAKLSFAALAAGAALYLILLQVFPQYVPNILGHIPNIIENAYAQAAATTAPGANNTQDNRDVGRLLLVFVCSIFLIALVALFVIEDRVVDTVHVNAQKISAADTIVKTFGGLIIGLLSSIYNVHQ